MVEEPPVLADAAVYDPKELEEDVDMDVDQRKRVLDMFYRLGAVDHYALLGVPRAADKKTIKRAYFELTAHFHPDKFFRKRLGAFKAKMEAIFGRITVAHDVLTDKAQRAEYDAYIGDVEHSRGIEEMLRDVIAEMERAEKAVHEAVPEAPPPPVAAPAPPPPAPPPAPAASTPRPSKPKMPAVDDAARRAVLARRLLGGRAPPPGGRPNNPNASVVKAAPPPSPSPHESTAAAMDALRRRYEDRVSVARRFQATKYAENAQAALSQSDPVAAANAFKVAVSLQPEDPELKRAYDEAQQQADGILSESYERQATYEERSEKWDDAARSWQRVAEARRSAAKPQERTANALMKSGGNLHEALSFARRAVELEPDNVPFRATLAAAYLAAGLTLNARRELDTAAQISPHDGTIQALLKKIGKSG